MEESLGGDILLLEDQAKKLSDSMVDFGLDWDEETTAYVTNGGAAASYMAPAINAMKEAARNTSSQETRDLAAKAVADARESINERMMSIQQRLTSLENRIAGYNSQIATLTSRINNATEDTDVASLTNSINAASEMIRSSISIGNFFDACTTKIFGLTDFQRAAQIITTAFGKNRENLYIQCVP